MTKSSWSHAAIYVGNQLKDNNAKHVTNLLSQLDDIDRQHILIEADAGNGVTAVPLSKYKDYNIRICRPFGISAPDLKTVVEEVVDNLGKHYDYENLLDLALLVLPSFINPLKIEQSRRVWEGVPNTK